MTQYHKNSHTIGGLPEKPYSSLTGRPSKKINCPQIILSYSKQNTNKKQHCADATGHKADPDAFKRFIISGAIYHLIVWSPSLIEDNEAVESVQRKLSKGLPELYNYNYVELNS